jgi:hypothetical protein
MHIPDFLTGIVALAVFYVLPAYFIIRDQRVQPIERALWLLATLIVSWLAFLLFLFVAPVSSAVTEHEAGQAGDIESEEDKAPNRGGILVGKIGLAIILVCAGVSLAGFAFLAFLLSGQPVVLEAIAVFGVVLLGVVLAIFLPGRFGLAVGVIGALALIGFLRAFLS